MRLKQFVSDADRRLRYSPRGYREARQARKKSFCISTTIRATCSGAILRLIVSSGLTCVTRVAKPRLL